MFVSSVRKRLFSTAKEEVILEYTKRLFSTAKEEGMMARNTGSLQ